MAVGEAHAPGDTRAGYLAGLFALASIGAGLPLLAQEDPAAQIRQLETALEQTRTEYAERLQALEAEMADRLHVLEVEIAHLRDGTVTVSAGRGPLASAGGERWSTAGDFRVRYEHTTRVAGLPARDRGVLRARLGFEYRAADGFRIGGRLVTGDPDDPNSADVTMGEFADDLTVSLDRAYVGYRGERLDASAGKVALPFRATDLVWDSDVNPPGAGGRYTWLARPSVNASFAALYFLVDEAIETSDSDMAGAQLSFGVRPAASWNLAANIGYYDYEIGSLLAANAGDIRGNNLDPSGLRYLSDFNLVDLLIEARYEGDALRWPLSVAIDYVQNLGAAVEEDTGYALNVAIGSVGDRGDWRVSYGYSVAETDAVLAAFSNDNTTYATNYQQHALAIDYAASLRSVLNLTAYYYRRDDFSLVSQPGDNDYVTRLRLNLQYDFD